MDPLNPLDPGSPSDMAATLRGDPDKNPLTPEAEGNRGYSPIFNYAGPGVMDADPTGELTREYGRRTGKPLTADTVLELQIGREVFSAEQLRQVEGGEALLAHARRQRNGRRGFIEAMTTGSPTDFLPYVGDIASTGIAIKNMATVRDSLKKMAEGGAESMSLQEKVLTKLYVEDMTRQSTQNFGGTVGTIVRQAPAFALEFLLTGGLFKAGSKALGMAAREGTEEVIGQSIRKEAAARVFAKMKEPLMKKELLDASALGMEKFADDLVANVAEKGADEVRKQALKATAMKAAEAYVTAVKNPSFVKNVGEFVTEYGKRGLFDHMDDVVRDLPPSVMGKLREAAGVAFVEAPIKGGLYAAFDFLVANPVAAKVMGAEEAVTKTELGLYASGDEELMRNAKMLAFGSAWAEYASEISGRAFNAIGGMVTQNLAGQTGRALARSGLRARADFVKEGSIAKQIFDATYGTEAQLKSKLLSMKDEVLETAFRNAPDGKIAGKTLSEARTDRDLTEKLMRESMEFKEKSFLGYWIANKALEKNITPQAVTKTLEMMGYDDILGEFMEERYSGFATGLFELDGQDDKGFAEKMAHIARTTIPSFQQGAAEILAFAIPVVGRATINKAYGVIGAGPLGQASEAVAGIKDLLSVGGLVNVRADHPTEIIDIRYTDKESGSEAARLRESGGREKIKQENIGRMQTLDASVDKLTDFLPTLRNLKEGKLGPAATVARAALGVVNAVISGNPLMAFNNPVGAMVGQELGNSGRALLNSADALRRSLYAYELGRRAGKTAEAVEKEGGAESLPESAFNDPSIEAAIRPMLRAGVATMTKELLRNHGSMVVDETDVDAFMGTLAKDPSGNIAGLAPAEFKNRFYGELTEAAAGRMSFDVVDGRAHLVYRRPEGKTLGDVAKSMETFLAKQGVSSFIDAESVDDVRATLRATAGVGMDVELFKAAAGDGYPADDPKVQQARMRLVSEIMLNPRLGDMAAWAKAATFVADYARTVLEVNKSLLRPTFESPAGKLEISGTNGAFGLRDMDTRKALPGTSAFATIEEAAAAAEASGFRRSSAQIYFTPSNATYIPHASMLLSNQLAGSRDYMLGHRGVDLGDSPYMTMEHAAAKAKVTKDLELSAKWLNRKNAPFANAADEAEARTAYYESSADTTKDADATEDGYETKARKAAEALGIREYQKPDTRGRKGYIYAPAAVSDRGSVYIPYKWVGSAAAVIEDGVENALKRDSSMFRDPLSPGQYSPAAKAFMNVVLNQLNILQTDKDAKIRREATFLADLFTPDKYNIEAVSHAITAFSFMQGDAAVKGTGAGGSAFYGTLGLVAKEVRGHEIEYDAFQSLVNRLVGGGMLGADGGRLTALVQSFVPARFKDDMDAVRTRGDKDVKYNPLTDPARSGLDLVDYTKDALAGKPRSGLRAMPGTAEAAKEQAEYKRQVAAKLAAGYLEEDLPFVLEGIKGAGEERDRKMGAEIAARFTQEDEDREAMDAAREAAAVNPNLPPPEPSNSVSEDTLVGNPAFAILFAEKLMETATPEGMGDDKRGRLDRVFDVWMKKDPLLKEGFRQRFFDAVAKAGLLNKPERAGPKEDLVTPSDDAFTAQMDAFFDRSETDDEDSAPAEGADDTEAGETDAPDFTGGYNEGAAARDLENSAHAVILRNVMHMNLPGAQHNDQEALQMLFDASAAMYAKGSLDPDSVASLFDEDAWTDGVMHPALVDDAAFEEWTGRDRKENGDPLFDDVIAALKAMGRHGAFQAADKLKGSYGRDILVLTADIAPDGSNRGASFAPRRQSLSPNVTEFLTRGAKDPGNDPAAAVKLLTAELAAGPKDRIGRLADAADLMFGRNNYLSQVLRKEKVKALINAAVQGSARAKEAGREMTREEVSDQGLFTSWFVSFNDADGAAGLIAGQMLKAARQLVEGRAELAVRFLLRGDALFYSKKHEPDASNRGGVLSFLNKAAGEIPVASASRIGEAAGKTRGIDPAMSFGQRAFLLSDEFVAAYKAAGGTVSGLARARRFGEWADGTKIFAALAGVTRVSASGEEGEASREKIPVPTYEEVSDLTRVNYAKGKEAVALVALYNSEKDMERIIQIPRKALAAVAGKADPSYEDVLAKLSDLLRISRVSPKRGAVHMAAGAAAEIQNATVAVILPEDTGAWENFHGQLWVGHPELAEYYRMQGFESSAKVVFTGSPKTDRFTQFFKGQFILADRDAAEGAQSPAAADLFRIAKEYALLTDKDSLKEGPLYYKADDDTGRTLMELAIAGDTSVTVKVPGGKPEKASDLIAEIGVTVSSEKVNGSDVTIVSYRTGLRSQWASAPSKKAAPKSAEAPVNYVMDNPEMWGSMNAQAKIRRALATRTGKADKIAELYEGLPDSVRRLLDAGVSPSDPDVMKIIGPKLASKIVEAYKPTMFGQQYLNRNFDGARVVEAEPGVPARDSKGRMVVSDPYGGMKAMPGGILHDTYELSPEESEAMGGALGGAVRRLASTEVNVGGMTSRYGLRASGSSFGLRDNDHAGIAAAIEARVLALKAAELASAKSGDDASYLASYKSLIDGVFTDHAGNPLQPGQILSFADLVTYVDDRPVFDRTRIYPVNENGESYVFLGGQLEISGRTPSRDGRRAEYAHSVARPAYMEEADGTQFYRAVYTKKDGTLGSKKIAYPVGTLVPGKDAILKMTPEAKELAGSDEDWDKSHSQRLPTDFLGREALEVRYAEEWIGASFMGPTRKEDLQRVHDKAIAGLEAKGFWAAIGVHRSAAYKRMESPVRATPFSKDYAKAALPAAVVPGLGTVEAAGFAKGNKDAGTSRGISVRVVGDLLAAVEIGLTFKVPVNQGRPVLRKPAGATASFWADGFRVGADNIWTPERLTAFIDAASGVANSTFDDLKEALAARAGFRPEFLDLYLYLGFESGVRSQAEYESFHTAFMEWMNSPEGKEVTRVYNHDRYPARYGGAALTAALDRSSSAIRAAIRKETMGGKTAPYHYRAYRDLSMPHRLMVDALANANGGGAAGFDAAFPLVETLLRLQNIAAVGGTLAYKKARLAFVDKVQSALNTSVTVANLLDSDRVEFTRPGGREALVEARGVYSDMIKDAFGALAGSPELSPMYDAVVSNYVSKAKQKDDVLRAINSRLPAEAACLLTPPSTGAKVDAIIKAAKANGANATADFIAATESALKKIFASYAKSKAHEPNAALDALLMPSKKNGASRITLTGSDDVAAVQDTLRAAMLRLRDWTPADKSVGTAKMGLRGGGEIEITPADFYHMLLIYSALTSEKAVETGRANQSLLSGFYGDAVYKKVSDYQIQALKNPSVAGPERLLEFTNTLLTDYDEVMVRGRALLNGVPDLFSGSHEMPWGGYDKYVNRDAATPEETPAADAPLPEVPESPEAVAADKRREALPLMPPKPKGSSGSPALWRVLLNEDSLYRDSVYEDGISELLKDFTQTDWDILSEASGRRVNRNNFFSVAYDVDVNSRAVFVASGKTYERVTGYDPRTLIPIGERGTSLSEEVDPEQVFQPTTFREATSVLESRDTILSSKEARRLNKLLGIAPGNPSPRILVASEKSDPVWFAQEVKAKVAEGIYDALYIVTKHDGLPLRDILQLPIPKMIHFSVTTLGGTAWEPGVMKWRDLMDRVADFIKQGLDPRDVTIRIDPLVPDVTDMKEVREVLKRATSLGLTQFRFSVMDGYSGPVEAKIRSLYPAGVMDKNYVRDGKQMNARPDVVMRLANEFADVARAVGVTEVGSCAENVKGVRGVRSDGCLPVSAVEAMLGRPVDESKSKQRPLCKCFGGKVDALAYTNTCPSSCVYCYARHGSDAANQYYNADGTLKKNRLTETRVGHTDASAAMRNFREQAKAVASAKADARLLPTFAFYGKQASARMTEAHVAAAGQMAQAVRHLSDVPWVQTIPGYEATLAAASDILTAMRYPEPAVFTGAVRALGRAAVAAKATDAVDQLRGLYADLGAAQSADAARLADAVKDTARILAAPAAQRVMEFAVISEPRFNLTDKNTPTAAIAKRILDGLETKEPEMSASFAAEDADAVGSQINRAREDLKAANKRLVQIDAQMAAAVKLGGAGERQRVMIGEQRTSDLALVETLRERIRELSQEAKRLRELDKVIEGSLATLAEERAGYTKDLSAEEGFGYRVTFAETKGVMNNGTAAEKQNAALMEIAAIGHVPARQAKPVAVQLELFDADTADTAMAKEVAPISASLADSDVQSDFGITDEELQAYVADEKAGKYYAAETLQEKFQKRLKALTPPMPDEFEVSNGDRYSKKADGSYELFIAQEGLSVPVLEMDAKSEWDKLTGARQAGSFATVAQAIEDWKRDEGVVYDPNDAYSRGEGFYHDVGAFNPQAPGLIGGIAKVLLAQERKRRAGDLRYWEDTANQLVVSAYTARRTKKREPASLAAATEFLSEMEPGETTKFKKVDGVWHYWSTFRTPQWVVAPENYLIQGWNWKKREPTPVRPGSGLRFVIRPSSQNILWAAKGDVYSGTVEVVKEKASIVPPELPRVTKDTPAAWYSAHPYAAPWDEAPEVFIITGVKEETPEFETKEQAEAYISSHVLTSSRPKWEVRQYSEMKAADDSPTLLLREEFGTKKEAEAFIGLLRGNTSRVDPKAPAAEKLGLLSHTLAGAIEDRRPQNYNELGVRLALGNFYIEGVPGHVEQMSDRAWAVMGPDGERLSADYPSEAAAQRYAKGAGYLPEELRRLNEHLKRAFIAVHGSLDPVAPYTPKTIPRRAGEMTASLSDMEGYTDELVSLVRRADAEISGLTKDEPFEAYVKQFPDDKFLRKKARKPGSLSARMPLFLGAAGGREEIRRYGLEQIKLLSGLKYLGSAKDVLVNALGAYYRTEDKTQLRDVAVMGRQDFADLMKAAGNSHKYAAQALAIRRQEAERLDGAAREAAMTEVEAAESAYFATAHLLNAHAAALRPKVNKAVNTLRARVLAVENERLDAPKGIEPPEATPESLASELGLIDPDTGHPDPTDDFHVTFVDSDAWFYGTVFPDFRGADIRKILFDKETLAAQVQAISAANRFEALFGLDSETGSLRKLTRMKGLGHHLLNGAYVYDGETSADTVKFDRRKLFKEQADIVTGNAFSDSEFALARWFGGAVYAFMGDGGAKARQALAGEVKFDLPWSEGADKLALMVTVAEAERRQRPGGERPYAVHNLLLRAKDTLPAELLPYVESALQSAVRTGAMAAGDKGQAAMAALEKAGYAVARRRDIVNEAGTVTGTRLYDVRLAVPVDVSAAVFRASTAHDKLVRNGRLPEELTMEANARALGEAFKKVNGSAAALGWVAHGDAKMFSDVGTAAPFFKGTGAYQYFSRKLQKPVPPEYRDAVQKAYDSLKDMFSAMKTVDRKGVERWTTGKQAASSDRYSRMFMLLKDLEPGTFGDAVSSADVWAVIESGRASGLGLSGSSRAWDVAKAIYGLSVAKLHASAWAGGTVEPTDMQTVGLEAFNRAIGEAAAKEGEDFGMSGATFSDIYDKSGALPMNITAGEALAQHAREIAEMTRYRLALNQLLMTSDEEGMPLVYAKPGRNEADDTVPDRMWGMLARWWAQTHQDRSGGGVYYDESVSGRENARRLYDEIARGKTAGGSERDVNGNLRRYVFTDVEIPPGMETFEAVSAAKDPAGDDTKARMNAFGGGEAAAIVRQTFAIAGFGRPDAKLAGINRTLSWSKSASVMASVFFPIATAFESPVAAVGMGSTLLGLSKTGADFGRWLGENKGWIAKAAGVNDISQAPFMADIMRVIGSDDPALVDLKMHAILSGISLADRARNMLDTDRTVIAQDIKSLTEKARMLHGVKAAKSLKAFLEGAMEHSSELSFEYVINATKIAVFAQMNNRLRQKAIAAGRWWDPVRDMKKWANYINAEVGGIDPATYPWMTPKMQQWMKMLMFSWEWTLGAWEAGGGGVLTQKIFGQTTGPRIQKFMLGRWVRMYGAVMIGIPAAMQLLITAVAKGFGDDEEDDKWLSMQNEMGHGWKDFDITPLLRRIANAHLIPFVDSSMTWGELKKKLPGTVAGLPFGNLIPGLTGDEGEMVSTRKRRYYMHMGKQGWEVAGWFTDPTRSFLSKMSMPSQKILEGVLGITPSMGWDKEWKELGFWERWTSLDPEKSALLNLGTAFVPFSAMGMSRNPEAGALSAIGPLGKGMSKTRAEKEMARMFSEWGDAETYIAMHKGKPGAWTDLTAMSTEWLEALRLNGYNPETSLKNALAAARKPLYERVHKALPAGIGESADTVELEAAARGLYRLDFVAKNLIKSIRARDKNQNIKRVDDLARATDAGLKSAFSDPYGKRG